MNVAAVLPLPGFCSPVEDRSLGKEGGTLRDLIVAATPPPSRDRGDEIYSRFVDALEKARRQDGILISPEVFTRTLDVMMSLPLDFPLARVVVESENEVGLDWDEGNRKVVSLTVDDTSTIGFSALLGKEPLYGRVEFAEGIPEVLRFLLARLFPEHP